MHLFYKYQCNACCLSWLLIHIKRVSGHLSHVQWCKKCFYVYYLNNSEIYQHDIFFENKETVINIGVAQ